MKRFIGILAFSCFLIIKTFASTISVKDFGAVGDGITNDTVAIQSALDDAFGPASSPHGTANVNLNKTVYFPNGNYKITSPLTLTKLHGGRLIGDGRFVTKITQATPSASVIVTNGCGYSHFEGMLLQGTGTGIIFDLNWDGTAGGAALQSNTFTDMFFYGENFGVQIGRGGFMGSENLFLNCFWLSNATAGMMISNYNALQQTVIGGNFQLCGNGIWVGSGSVPVISGVGFQLSTGYDIRIESIGNNNYHVSGCRSESKNFIFTVAPIVIDGCSHISASGSGDFLWLQGGPSKVSASRSTSGRILARYWAILRVEESQFNRNDWIAYDQLWWIPNNTVPANIELEGITYGYPIKIIRRQRIVSDGAGGRLTYEYNLTQVPN